MMLVEGEEGKTDCLSLGDTQDSQYLAWRLVLEEL